MYLSVYFSYCVRGSRREMRATDLNYIPRVGEMVAIERSEADPERTMYVAEVIHVLKADDRFFKPRDLEDWPEELWGEKIAAHQKKIGDRVPNLESQHIEVALVTVQTWRRRQTSKCS